MYGKFIVLEGGEGSGKSSCIEYLKEHLRDHDIIYTREPGGTPTAENIRKLFLSGADPGEPFYPTTELFLVCAARAQHVAERIRPALRRGVHVICDRFNAGTFGYQLSGNDRRDLLVQFGILDKIARGATFKNGEWIDPVEPNLYILMDIDPEVGLMRRAEAGGANRFEEKSLEFHKRVREGLFEYLSSKPHRVVDTHRPHEEVLKEVLRIVRRTFEE